jgi:hypothetical protein
MDDVGRYNFRPRYNFNVTATLINKLNDMFIKQV